MSRTPSNLCAAMAAAWSILFLTPMGAADESQDGKHNAAVLAHHDSAADGTKQPFVIQFPDQFSPDKPYPLLIYLAQNPPNPDKLAPSGKPYFKIYVGVHGILAFPGLADADVMAAISTMKRDYPIDERRIFLSGFSAGGSAVMTITSRHPDVFAGAIPLGAFGNNAFLDSLYNLPVFCHHGQRDWVSAICNVRVYHQQLRAMGAPALLKEYPARGHSVGAPENMDRWLMAQRRVERPRRIVHRCDTPDQGQAYWLHIRQFIDIHQHARVSARYHGGGEHQTLIVQADNIAALQFAFDRSPIQQDHPLTIQANSDQLHLEPPLPADCVLVRGESGWTIQKEWRAPDDARRPYRPGASANHYTGEPLLIVYGTKSADVERTTAFKQIADELATCGGPYCLKMKGRFASKADTLVTDEDIKRFNLLLIGAAEDNAISQRMAAQFPFSVSASGELQVANRAKLPLNGSVLNFAYFNPLEPRRLVYLFAPYLATEDLKQLHGKCARLLVGADGLRKGDQPDLVVQTVERMQRRHMQFDQRWQWRHPLGSDFLLPQRCRTRDGMAEAILTVMQRRAAADFGLWWGMEDKLFYGHDFNIVDAYDPTVYTQADYRCKTSPRTSMTGSVSGAELRDIYDRWIAKRELLSVPPFDPQTLDPRRQYRIVLPHELVVKLGSRKKLLNNVAEGPAVTTEEILREVCRD